MMDAPDLLLLQSAAAPAPAGGSVPDMVRILRKHLGMDVAFVAELRQDLREIRLVDTDERDCPVQPGTCTPIEETYCRLVIDGTLPELMPDITAFPAATALPITAQLGIASYLSAPIRLADGSIYGTLCCYSHAPDATLGARDLAMIRACAEMTAIQVERQQAQTRRRREIEDRVRSVLAPERITMVYQPIYDLPMRAVAGFESLSRFDDACGRPPDVLFNEAHEVGLGMPLETKAVQLGLSGLQHFAPEVYVSVNASPETILDPAFGHAVDHAPLDRVTLEVTEHAAVNRYREIEAALAPLRRRGMQLAVDDAGAGYASFRHILQLAPDRIKLDCSLIRDIDADPARRALIAAFVRFGEETGASLIAEGVERDAELKVLQDLGVHKVQGYLLGRPMPLAQAVRLAQR